MFAQGITDVATTNAGLPSDRRVLPTQQVALELPLWGSILDDVWSLRTDLDTELNQDAATWMDRVETQWSAL
eukprot:13034196-Alexandrium_andersonii.AAC.1